MNNKDLTSYCDQLIVNPKINIGNSRDIDYVKRVNGLINVIRSVANAIEYNAAINTCQKLNAAEKLIIHQNILPYFTPTRAKYSDVIVLSLAKNEESNLSVLPFDIIRYILILKSQLGFVSCMYLVNKFYIK